MKIGLIGRADRTGLGVETRELMDNLPINRLMVVSFEGGGAENGAIYALNLTGWSNTLVIPQTPSDEQIRAFLSGLDIVLAIETPYNPRTFKIAREMGVKSILRVNYEWLDEYNPAPDLWITPSLWHFNDLPAPTEYLPFPINTKKIPFKPHNTAHTFLHIAGNMKAGYDRNGTEAFLKAIPLVKNKDIKFLIKSQVPIEVNDPRATVDCSNKINYWENWTGETGDVLVLPRRYAGQSLPMQEAIGAGLAIMATDMQPQNELLPKDLLIPIRGTKPVMIKKVVDVAEVDPSDIAQKIDQFANKDISRYSAFSWHIREQWSWEKLKEKYLYLFETICRSHH